MRSITIKLILAFLLASVAGIALAAVVIRQSVVREFDDYVVAQRRDEFTQTISSYYAVHGNWNGVAPWLREQRTAALAQASGDRTVLVAPPGFMLADPSGTIIMPPDTGRRLDQFDQATQARATTVQVDGKVVGVVVPFERANFRNFAEERYLQRTLTALGIATVGAIGIALALGVLLARVITRPVRELTAAAERIAAGDLEQQVPVRSRDELGVLATQFNRMSADIARANALRRRMTADIAHDLRTPLTVIAGYLESLRDRVLKPTPERFATMYDETQLLLHLVDDLHTLSLADAGELPLTRQRIAPQLLLERVADAYRDSATLHGVELQVIAEPGLPDVSIDLENMVRALSNLVNNALRYTPAGGVITLHVSEESQLPSAAASITAPHNSADGRRSIVFSVHNNGTAIAPEHVPSIFERFYRADASRSQNTGGSGLGLAIVKSLVEAHGGQVTVDSTPVAGTTFTIALPEAEPLS